MPRSMSLLGALLIVPLSVSSAPASNENPFVGRWHWDGPETCAKDYDGDNVAMQITNERLIFYENTCAIRSMRKLGDRTYRLQLTCKGEGGTERSELLLSLLAKSKVNEELLLRIELNSGFVLGYRRCP
jgi:hypothetical protein